MGFFDDFFGKSQQKDIAASSARADSLLQAGGDAATRQYTNAMGRFDPYSQTGLDADAMLARALGLRGRPEYQGVVNDFMGDPFREGNAQWADEAILRLNNAHGRGRAPVTDLAIARANLERGSTDWNNWLDRLTGAKGSGLQVAGAQAGIDTGLGDLQFGVAQQRAGNEISRGNAMAASRSTGINNLLGIAGTAVKGFTPGWGGSSAFGNMAGGVKNAMASWYPA